MGKLLLLGAAVLGFHGAPPPAKVSARAAIASHWWVFPRIQEGLPSPPPQITVSWCARKRYGTMCGARGAYVLLDKAGNNDGSAVVRVLDWVTWHHGRARVTILNYWISATPILFIPN